MSNRVLRPLSDHVYEVRIDNWPVGRVKSVAAGYLAYGEISMYGDVELLTETTFPTMREAALAVADAHASQEEYRAAEAKSEFIGEYGMGAVCGGASPGDALLMAEMAWAEQMARSAE